MNRHMSRGLVLGCLFSVSCAAVIIGISMSKQKAPNSGWKGPVQCISISSKTHGGVAELCGQSLRRSVQWPKFLELAGAPSENSTACSTCEVEVACGASEKLANLVDGEGRPHIRSSGHALCEVTNVQHFDLNLPQV